MSKIEIDSEVLAIYEEIAHCVQRLDPDCGRDDCDEDMQKKMMELANAMDKLQRWAHCPVCAANELERHG